MMLLKPRDLPEQLYSNTASPINWAFTMQNRNTMLGQSSKDDFFHPLIDSHLNQDKGGLW